MGRTFGIKTFTILFLLLITTTLLFGFTFVLSASADEDTQCVTLYLNGGAIDELEQSEDDAIVVELLGEEYVLPIPTKSGYTFLGWSKSENGENEEFVTVITPDSEIEITNLYALYELNAPIIEVKPTDYSGIYGEGTHTLTVTANHDLSTEFSYQWYKDDALLEEATTNELKVNDVNQSGVYFVTVTVTVNEESKTAVSESATIAIKKSNLTSAPQLIIDGVYDPEKTLADYELESGYFWEDATIVPTPKVRVYNGFYNIDSDNYNDLPCNIIMIIAKAEQDITVENIVKEYDGTEISITATTSGDSVLEYSDNNSLVNVGKELVTIKAPETSCYLGKIITATLEIVPQPIEVVWENLEFTYDGVEHIPSATAINLNGETVELDVAGTNINAGTYIAVAKSISFNYTLQNSEIEFIINPQTVNVIWNDLEFTYDGVEHIPSATATDLNGETVELCLSGAGVNANNYIAIANVTTENYTLQNSEVEFTIYPQIVKVEWVELEFTFDGLEHIPTAECLDLSEIKVDLAINNPQVDAGIYTAEAVSISDNYQLENSFVEFVINKATYDSDLIIFEDKEVVFDGEPHSIEVSELPEWINVEYDVEATEAGFYTVVATFTVENPNYNEIPEKSAKLTILQSKFKGDWYEISCPDGINPNVTISLKLIDDLSGLYNKNKGKFKYILGFKIETSDNTVYAKPMTITFNYENVNINHMVLSVNEEANEQIITYSYENGKIILNLTSTEQNIVLVERAQSIAWIIGLVIGLCVLVCVAMYIIMRKKTN